MYNLTEDTQVEVGPWVGAGIKLKELQGMFKYRTLLVFSAGGAAAASARALLNAQSKKGLQLDCREAVSFSMPHVFLLNGTITRICGLPLSFLSVDSERCYILAESRCLQSWCRWLDIVFLIFCALFFIVNPFCQIRPSTQLYVCSHPFQVCELCQILGD